MQVRGEVPEGPSEGDRLEALAAGAEDLAAALKGLNDSVLTLERRDRAQRRMMKYIWGLMALKIATIIGLVAALVGVAHANSKVEQSLQQNFVTKQQQDQTRVRVLCPLYALLLAATEAPPQGPALTPVQVQARATAIKTVQDGYRALGCTPALPASQ